MFRMYSDQDQHQIQKQDHRSIPFRMSIYHYYSIGK